MSDGKKIFFPGCALQQIAPELSEAAFEWLAAKGFATDQMLDCCGLPLKFEGKNDSFDQHTADLFTEFAEQGVSQIVVACPSCYRVLRTIAEELEQAPTILHLAKLMADEGLRIDPALVPDNAVFAVHDSCPDRQYQIAAEAVREIASDLNLVEMQHSRKRTMCCGIGEPFFGADHDVQIRQVNKRGKEAADAGATHILNACVNCTLAFTLGDKQAESVHYLELLFAVAIPREVVRDTHTGIE